MSERDLNFSDARILILGGAGYVGGALTDCLAQSGYYNVIVYDSLLFQEDYQKPGVIFVNGDVRNRELLKKYLDKADVVVNLAGHVGDAACTLHPSITLEVNREAVKFIANNFKGRIIHMSSCSVYGASDGFLNEESPTNPLSLYAISKLESEAVLKNSDAIIFRLGTLYGLSDPFTRLRSDLVLNTLTFKAWKDGKIKVFGGEQYRPLLHVYDAAQAIVSAISIPKSNTSQIFNLVGENLKIIDIANLVREFFDDLKIEITDIPTEDLRNYRASADKAKSVFSFSTTFSPPDGAEEIVGLLNSGRVTNVDNDRYHNFNWFRRYLPYFNLSKYPIDPILEREIRERDLNRSTAK